MSSLEVRHVQKIYTTRFGGTKVQALSDVNFTVLVGNSGLFDGLHAPHTDKGQMCQRTAGIILRDFTQNGFGDAAAGGNPGNF